MCQEALAISLAESRVLEEAAAVEEFREEEIKLALSLSNAVRTSSAELPAAVGPITQQTHVPTSKAEPLTYFSAGVPRVHPGCRI